VKETNMKVAELMAAPVITVREDCTLQEAAEIMVGRKIGCLPVVNQQGEICGIVTESDFSAREKSIPFSLTRFPQVLGEWLPKEGVEQIYSRARTIPVREIMQRSVVTVTAEDSLEQALEKMLANHVHRLPVVKGKTPVGMVARRDLLQLMLKRMAPALAS
jgi:CBS domain-containing protein